MSIVQNDTSPILFYMVLSTDHISAATGKTVTMTLSKAGAAFAAGGGAVTEISNGFYEYTPVTADVGTLGDLAFRATATGCDDWTDVRRVVQAGALATDWTSTRAAKVDNLDATMTSRASATTQTTMAATVATNLDAPISGVDEAVRTNLATELGRIDASVSSRASAATLAAGVTLTAGERTATAGAILATVVEANGGRQLSVKQILQLLAAFVMGKISNITAGSGTQTNVLRSATDLQTIVTYTTDELGNRTNAVETIP